MRNKRTKKDEQRYDEQLRQEEGIKTEVIVELRKQNKALWTTQARLLQSLIEAEAALRVYRLQALEIATRNAQAETHCVPDCTRHEWDTVEGWRRLF